MNDSVARPLIPESVFQHRQFFADPWIDLWIVPNPFISALASPLRAIGVGLSDFSFNKDFANLGDTFLNISIRKLNAAVRIGLETVTFTAENPGWEIAPQLAQVFDQISVQIRNVVGVSPRSQEATLAFHVTAGTSDFGETTASLVSKDLVADSLFCGVSLHKRDGALIIDKSLRHEGAAFVRLQRRFASDVPFAEIALRLYEDEVAALRLLGISEVP